MYTGFQLTLEYYRHHRHLCPSTAKSLDARKNSSCDTCKLVCYIPGGFILVKDGKVLQSMPMPIGGLMSDQSGEWVDEKLREIHEVAYTNLQISRNVEPIMTLCFMSLAVIPEIKLTDKGLFDVTQFKFIPIEA